MLLGNEGTKKNDLKITINDGDGTTSTLCLDTNKLTVIQWLRESVRVVKLKMNEKL